ncbi:hypothetical protein SAMN05444397_107222 [Flavobacterium aquidurense]|nr:hypothetical protein SAMN05444397_107222 [Flavobacterium aquidurense]
MFVTKSQLYHRDSQRLIVFYHRVTQSFFHRVTQRFQYVNLKFRELKLRAAL